MPERGENVDVMEAVTSPMGGQVASAEPGSSGDRINGNCQETPNNLSGLTIASQTSSTERYPSFVSSTGSTLSSSPSTATIRSSKSNNSSEGADPDAANNTNNSTNLSSVSGGDSLHENSQKTRSKSMSLPRAPRTPVTVLERPEIGNEAMENPAKASPQSRRMTVGATSKEENMVLEELLKKSPHQASNTPPVKRRQKISGWLSNKMGWSRRSGRGQGGDGDDIIIGSLFDDEDELDNSQSITTTPPTIKMERADTTAEYSHSSSGIGAGGDASSNSRPPASTPSPSNRRHGTSLLADAVEKKCSYIDVANNQQRNIFSRSLLNSSSLRKASAPGMPSPAASIKNKFWRNLPKTEDVRAGRCQRFAKQILKKEREAASPKSQAHRPLSDSKAKDFPDNAGQVTFENARKKGYAFGSTYEKKPLDQNNKTKVKSSLKIRTDLTMDNAPVAPNKNLNTSGVNEFLEPTSDVSPHTKLDPIDVYSVWPFAYGSPAYGYLESFFRTDLDFLSWEREYLRSRVRTDLPAVEGRNDRRVRSLSCSSSPYLQLKSYLPPPPPEDSTSALPYGDYVVGCELPSLSFGDMCPHPDLPLAMAEGTNVVTDTSDPLFTLDYMVECSLKFNLLLAELPLVLARADAFGDLARDTICKLEAKSIDLQRQTTTLKLRIAKVVEESDQAMSRSNGFSKYPGSEIAVFWQRLNDWVEHLARQYVLFGRELEWTIHDFVPPEVGRDALTPFNTGNIARQCLTGFFSIPSGSNQSLGNMVTSYLDSCYNEVRQMSPDIAAKFNAAVHRIKEIGSRYNIDVEKYMNHAVKLSVDHLSEFKSKMYDWSGRLGFTNPGNGANTSTESSLNSTGGSGSPSDSSVISVEEDGNKLEWEEQPSPPSPLTPLTPQRPPPAFFHLMTDRQIRRFVQLEGNPVSTSSSPSHSPPKM